MCHARYTSTHIHCPQLHSDTDSCTHPNSPLLLRRRATKTQGRTVYLSRGGGGGFGLRANQSHSGKSYRRPNPAPLVLTLFPLYLVSSRPR